MSEIRAPETDRNEVTSIIRHRVRPENVQAYEAWLKKIVPIARSFPGHSGVNVIRPHAGANEYTVVLHFQSVDSLQNWLTSATRNDLVAEASPLLEDGDRVEIQTGLEFWFTPASSAAPRATRYKQALAALSVIYPLSLAIPPVLHAPLESAGFRLPSFVFQFVVVSIIVFLMTYVIMPRYSRLIAHWLYR